MKSLLRLPLYIFLLGILGFFSCEKGDELINPPGNRSPIADAGPDQVLMLPVDYTTLDGKASIDPDGTINQFQWASIDGPSCTIEKPGEAQTLIKGLQAGTYQFELTVKDNAGSTAKDMVQVIVSRAGLGDCDFSNRPQVHATLTEIGTLSEARMPYVSVSGNKIIFAGGYTLSGNYYGYSSAVDIYDVVTGEWTRERLNSAGGGIAVVNYGNKVFFAGGGYAGKNDVDIYDAGTGEWNTARLSESRSEMAAAVVGTKVLFAGGGKYDSWDGWWALSKRVDIYDFATNSWSTAELSEARRNLCALTVGDKVYFAGGYDAGDLSNRIDIYDNANSSNQWSTASLRDVRGPLAGVVIDNNIYWSGMSGQINTAKTEVFYTGTNNSATVGCLSYQRILPTAVLRNNVMALFPTGLWINNDRAVLSNKFDIYNLSANSWSIGLLDHPVEMAGIVSVNNTVYMGGGRTGNASCSNKVYKVDW